MFPVIQIRFLCPCAVQESFLFDVFVVFAASVITRNHTRQIKASLTIIEIKYIVYRPVITILCIETVIETETFSLRLLGFDSDNGIHCRVIARTGIVHHFHTFDVIGRKLAQFGIVTYLTTVDINLGSTSTEHTDFSIIG